MLVVNEQHMVEDLPAGAAHKALGHGIQESRQLHGVRIVRPRFASPTRFTLCAVASSNSLIGARANRFNGAADSRRRIDEHTGRTQLAATASMGPPTLVDG